jgi:hypothetical protein
MERKSKFSPEVRERAVRLMTETAGESRFGVGGDHFGGGEDRLHTGDAAEMDPSVAA